MTQTRDFVFSYGTNPQHSWPDTSPWSVVYPYRVEPQPTTTTYSPVSCLTEDDVRRIIREELKRLLLEDDE